MSSYAITGASKGLGYEFVRQLSADANNTVLAIVRNPESASISELTSSRSNVHAIKGDVTDPKSILEAASAAAAITGGKLDVLIHNSNAVDEETVGFNPTQFPFDAEATKDLFAPALDTGVFGGIWATNAFLPLIEKGVQKKIIHISSGMADIGLIRKAGISYTVSYAVAKAGMNVLVAKYAVELAPKGIKVLAISPGWVDTWDGPKPTELIQGQALLLSQFQKVEPALKGQIQPKESVEKCLQVIQNIDDEQNGTLVSQNGDTVNWF